MTNESSANAIIGNTLRIIASGEYHPGAELTQKMASYIIELEKKLTDMAVQLANAESKCRELAAENARLKKFGETLFEMHNALSGSGTGIQGNYEAVCQQLGLEAAMDALDEIETPATDAFLAEVRAQGVELCADSLLSTDDIGIDSEYQLMREFAAQLRQEATQ